MISRPVTVSPVNPIFAIRLFDASAFPISAPGPFTTFTTPGGTMSPITSISFRIDHGVGTRRLDHRAVPGRQRRRHLPRRHQQREVERDDLTDHPQRLMEVVRVGVLVDLRDPPLLGTNRAREVAEVVGRRAECLRRASRAPACRSHSSPLPPASRGSPRSHPRPRSARPRARSAIAAPRHPWPHAPHRAPARCPPRRNVRPRRTARPVEGVRFSRYSPVVGATQSPPMKLS